MFNYNVLLLLNENIIYTFLILLNKVNLNAINLMVFFVFLN